MDKEYYLFVEGKKVVVSKEVYLAYHSELNKEKYQARRDRLNNCFFFWCARHEHILTGESPKCAR